MGASVFLDSDYDRPRSELFLQASRYTLHGLALFPLFIYVICLPDSKITRLLNNRFLTHIGDLSYSLYLVHYTVMAAVKRCATEKPLPVLLLTFIFSYGLARIIQRLVEKPSQSMRNRVLARARRQRQLIGADRKGCAGPDHEPHLFAFPRPLSYRRCLFCSAVIRDQP